MLTAEMRAEEYRVELVEEPAPASGEVGEPVAFKYDREGYGWELRARQADNLIELGYTETPLYTADMLERLAAQPTQQPGDQVELIDAAKAVIASAFDHYTARNGRRMSIEGDDGEKCWIVPFDDFEQLRFAVERAAIAAMPSSEVGQALVNCAGIQSNGGNGDLAYVKVFFKSAGDQDALFVLLNESLPTPPAQGEG